MSDALALARAARKMQTDVAAILAGEDFIGHGWVTPLPGGLRARCGGPNSKLGCMICRAEAKAANRLKVLDSVSTPAQRVRIAAALVPKVAKYKAASSALDRLRLANEIRSLLAQLGGVASGPSLAKLQAIAAGQHDAMGAEDLHYELKAELEDNWGESYDQALADDAEDAAHAAINRWMKVEEAEYA